MSTGDNNGRDTEDVSAPTIEHSVTVAAPTPLEMGAVELNAHTAASSSSESNPMADTAVATRSQAMAAVSPPDESAEDSMLGSVLLERYEITGKIGQGGMGAVYEATHILIGKRVAVKVLLDKYAQKDEVVARLEQEARLASSIGHEHIIDITDFGRTDDNRTFVVMEFLEGESLGAHLGREGAVEEQRAISIVHQVTSALGAAHKKGVVHRDIKPDNIFLLQRRGKDFVKVVDFGISKLIRPGEDADGSSPRLTQTGMVLGTPLYMSPEQARGDEELDHRIDIYAVGVILYEIVTGEVPFQGGNYLSILTQVINDRPTPPRDVRPEISEDLESVIMKALAKNPNDRYQSMEELADDLAILRTVDGATTGAKITASRFRRTWRQRSGLRVLGWVAGIAVVVSAVAVSISVMMSDDGDKQSAAVIPAAIDAGIARPPADAAPTKPAVDIAVLRLISSPKGASIYDGDRWVGDTPCDYRMEKANHVIELIAELDGFNDGKFEVNPAVELEYRVRLKRPKRGVTPTKYRPNRKPKTKPAVKEPAVKKPDDTAGGDLSGDPYKRKKDPAK